MEAGVAPGAGEQGPRAAQQEALPLFTRARVRDLLWLVLFTLLLHIPFLRQPVQGDEITYLEIARHVFGILGGSIPLTDLHTQARLLPASLTAPSASSCDTTSNTRAKASKDS